MRSETVCGELNAKNKMGAYVGFKRFLVDLTTSEALIDPDFSYDDLWTAEDSCRSLASSGYASASIVASACERSAELKGEKERQALFDAGWQKDCSSIRSKEFYRPPLNEISVSTNTVDNTGDVDLSGSGGEYNAMTKTIDGEQPADDGIENDNPENLSNLME